jgi:hypothetical protein
MVRSFVRGTQDKKGDKRNTGRKRSQGNANEKKKRKNENKRERTP